MRSVSIFTGLAAAVALGGCQQAGEPVALSEAAYESSGYEYGLHYLDLGERARLAYGVANSDVVRLMLECDKGSGKVDLSDTAAGGARLELTSGRHHTAISGVIEPGITAPLVMATASADVPALKAFRRGSALRVGEGENAYEIRPAAEERFSVERFFATCENLAS